MGNRATRNRHRLLRLPAAARNPIWLALGFIVPVAAIASYLQALIVVQAADGHGLVSYFVAGLADPTVFAASANILDARRKGQDLPWWSILSLAVSLLVTGGANVMAEHPHDVPPYLVKLWPPIAFVMALESLQSYARRNRKATDTGTDESLPDPAEDDAEPDEPLTTEDALRVLLATGSRRVLADALGVPKSRVDTWHASLKALDEQMAASTIPPPEPMPEPSLNGRSPNTTEETAWPSASPN